MYTRRRVHILIRNSCLYIMYRRKTRISGSFGDPTLFSRHKDAMLSNLIEAAFHLQSFLLTTARSDRLKANALYQFSPAFTNTDTKMQNAEHSMRRASRL